MLKISSGGNGGEGMGSDQLEEIMKMINELGDDLREDASKKYATKESLKGLAT
jgi:hypothetical protein